MKIRELQSKQILSLYLLKSKVYNQAILNDTSSSLSKSYLIEILASFKKALQIIFQYHTKSKLIVFVGAPENLRIKINRSTRHVALSKYEDFQKIVFSGFRDKNLFKGGKKPYLIVLIDHVNFDEVIKETYLAKIPLICINSVSNSSSYINYKVYFNHGSLQYSHSLFFLGLSFLFK